MSNNTSSSSSPRPRPRPRPRLCPCLRPPQPQKMSIENDHPTLNLFRLLWLIHTEDFSKLNNHTPYTMPPFNDFLIQPNKLSLIQILLADSLDENRYPMLTKGAGLMMLIERTRYDTQQQDPCIAYTNSPSRYLSTLAHIYTYLAKDLTELNKTTCDMIRSFVSKYSKKSREIKYCDYYDLGPAPTHIEYFQKITTIDEFWFGTMNFFAELQKHLELSNKMYGLHLETMVDHNLKEWYAGFSVPYFMLLHFRLVYSFYDMWTADAADADADATDAAAAATDATQKTIDKDKDKKTIPRRVQVFDSTWGHTTPQ